MKSDRDEGAEARESEGPLLPAVPPDGPAEEVKREGEPRGQAQNHADDPARHEELEKVAVRRLDQARQLARLDR